MSNVLIKRAVENIKSGTNIYTPVIEVIVNGIQAIEAVGDTTTGVVSVTVQRSPQLEIEGEDGAIPSIESFVVEDNGIGFNDKHREAFDTLYTDIKLEQGGKGFGRFTCLKYFDNVLVDSTFDDSGTLKRRQFEMGKETEIIVNEEVSSSSRDRCGTLVTLDSVRKSGLDKKLPTIARALVEKLLPYFIAEKYNCPQIILKEADGSEEIVLNDFLKGGGGVIQEIPVANSQFSIYGNGEEHEFKIRIFKFFSPRNSKSKISLVAHNREVTETPTHQYVPEFVEDFFQNSPGSEAESGRNYVIKTYVFGEYLNEHVALERGGFEFHKDVEALLGISQSQIERKAAELTKSVVAREVTSRQKKKEAQIYDYVENSAPWHRTLLKNVDLSEFPYNPSEDEIEARLQEEKFRDELKIRRDVRQKLDATNIADFKTSLSEIIERISDTSKNDLVHYVALRKNVLSLFGKILQLNANGKSHDEGEVHEIIFPKGKDSDSVGYEDHNLWLIDERLNFSKYLMSDVPLNGGRSERPDILSFDKLFAFRGDNEASNPVTIFEFKKPQRDDFANPSSKEDPVQQIVRYVNNIKDGKYRTPEGRDIQVANNTPFYGYVVCDLTEKVKKWLERDKNFTVMPDAMGWFHWYGNINLYIEVISWDKVLKDAEMRNRIFFHKLGV